MPYFYAQDQTPIYYEETGEGPPLLLLHGNGETHEIFQSLISVLSPRFHVVAMDSRGHGRSGYGNQELSLPAMADDCAALVQHLEIDKLSVLGFSDGGNIALYFALRYPEKLNCLVLIGANLNPGAVKRSTQIPIEIGYRLTSLFPTANGRKKRQILGLMIHWPQIRPEELEYITAPTLVLAGERDLIKEEHTRMIAQKIPHAQLEIIPKANHFVLGKQAAETNRRIFTFLTRNL